MTHLSPSGCRRGGRSNRVEAANYAEITSGPCDGNSALDVDSWIRFVRDKNRVKEHVTHTDIAPHWCPIDGISIPYDGVHEVNETTKCRPNHVHTCPHMPRVQMPIYGND